MLGSEDSGTRKLLIQKEVSGNHVSLGIGPSELGGLNVVEEAQSPSTDETLYEKLASALMGIYDNDAHDGSFGEARSKVVQLNFLERLAAILRVTCRAIWFIYSQRLKDLSGSAALTALSMALLQKSDIHCRQYRENLSMPMMPRVMVMLTK